MGPDNRPLGRAIGFVQGLTTAETGFGAYSHTLRVGQIFEGINLSGEKRDWGDQKDRP